MKSGKTGKRRVMVLYGGKSSEHEVALRSAASVLKHLDSEKYEILPVCVDKEGVWRNASKTAIEEVKRKQIEAKDLETNSGLPTTSLENQKVDVVFPVMHGTFCEDGAIQGFLEMAGVPYVGSGVLASAIGMDKVVAKRLAEQAGITVVPYVALKRRDFDRVKDGITAEVKKRFGFPVFVKPVSAGSSVGVHKVKKADQLLPAIEDAFRYDTKVLIEQAIDAREIEIAALESLEDGVDPIISVPGEIVPEHEFYSYEAKYLDENGAKLLIPADLNAQQTKAAQNMAREIFYALEVEGMARIDLFMDKKTGKFYFNEINTIPGFTSISMYPKMMEASGVSYAQLLTHLVELAVKRADEKNQLVRDFNER